jgi:hypothetical protein
MNPEFKWATIPDPTDKLVLENRNWYQQVFREAFVARRTQWIAQVLDEQPLQILVLFQDAMGEPYPPEVHFSAMSTKQDVETKTVFLPWP